MAFRHGPRLGVGSLRMQPQLSQGMLAVPFGGVLVSAEDSSGLSAVELTLVAGDPAPQSREPLIVQALEQLTAYFEGQRVAGFSVPLRTVGTPFERRVWNALVSIPVGMTVSYGRLAAQLGSSARAVAGACRANRWPLLVPCHRVVGEHHLGGYCGATDGPWLEVKRWLLRHEQALIHGRD